MPDAFDAPVTAPLRFREDATGIPLRERGPMSDAAPGSAGGKPSRTEVDGGALVP